MGISDFFLDWARGFLISGFDFSVNELYEKDLIKIKYRSSMRNEMLVRCLTKYLEGVSLKFRRSLLV